MGHVRALGPGNVVSRFSASASLHSKPCPHPTPPPPSPCAHTPALTLACPACLPCLPAPPACPACLPCPPALPALPCPAWLQDFEILMSGCVVIKPRSDIFNIHPPIFEVRMRGASWLHCISPLWEGGVGWLHCPSNILGPCVA